MRVEGEDERPVIAFWSSNASCNISGVSSLWMFVFTSKSSLISRRFGSTDCSEGMVFG